MLVPRAHLQFDIGLRIVVGVGAVHGEVNVECPPTGIRHDESVVTLIVHPRRDVLHVAISRLSDESLVGDGAVGGHAVAVVRVLGQVVTQRHLPHVVVACLEA